MKSMTFVAAALFATLSLPAFAEVSSTPRIDQRQQEQQQRIDQGVRSGDITSKEAAHLRKQQAKIRQMERQAMADGRMSAKEKAQIELAQNKESLRIAKQKHNPHTAK